ncbi:MAG TPA: phospholipase D-like domain-containing protein [Bryobacteraceae bacterium]|nr:phospholipase D-like domain-containing protein [Bryobacteraceae bacterium]
MSAFEILAVIAILVQAFLLFLAFFEPGLPYKITPAPSLPVDSDTFVRIIGTITDAQIHHGTRVEVFTNGESFYQAELETIRAARVNVNLEAYIFEPGKVADRFIDALAERARAGVKVKLVLDSIGSLTTREGTLRNLLNAGGEVQWYVPFRWYNLPRLNHRTHRELLIVDGTIGFLGGAGFADHWLFDKGRQRRWRDTMFRVEGEAVGSMQATFAENWLEASGEVLTMEDYYPLCESAGESVSLVVNSSPSAARGTRARMLFQTLLAEASRSIHITSPYFLPDRSARAELARAIRERGVEVQIVVPGHHTDHLLTRRSSRRLYGELLLAGARIYEYQPSMIHTKAMIVDSVWSVVGSTNFDNRSFGLNDEVNLAVLDQPLAARLEKDFAQDLADSRQITYDDWRRRPFFERFHEGLGWIIERQA